MPRKKVMQGSDLSPDFVEVPPKADNENFEAFIARVQRAKVNDGLVIVKATHPEITEPRLYQGIFSGFPVEPGPVGCVWSDGTTE